MNSDASLRQVHGHVISNTKCSEYWKTDMDSDMICFGDGTFGPCSVSHLYNVQNAPPKYTPQQTASANKDIIN